MIDSTIQSGISPDSVPPRVPEQVPVNPTVTIRLNCRRDCHAHRTNRPTYFHDHARPRSSDRRHGICDIASRGSDRGRHPGGSLGPDVDRRVRLVWLLQMAHLVAPLDTVCKRRRRKTARISVRLGRIGCGRVLYSNRPARARCPARMACRAGSYAPRSGRLVGRNSLPAGRSTGRHRRSRIRRDHPAVAFRALSPAGLGVASSWNRRATHYGSPASGDFIGKFLGPALEPRVPARFVRILLSTVRFEVRPYDGHAARIYRVGADPRVGDFVSSRRRLRRPDSVLCHSGTGIAPGTERPIAEMDAETALRLVLHGPDRRRSGGVIIPCSVFDARDGTVCRIDWCTMIDLKTLLLIAGSLHFGILIASALVPQVLDWRNELRK